MRIALERCIRMESPLELREAQYTAMENMLRRKFPSCMLERREILVTRNGLSAQWGGRDLLNPCYGEGVVRCLVIATVDEAKT